MEHKILQQMSLHSYKPLGEMVFENLRDAIISGRLAPGERLMENQVAELLGVSRTPVREAMKRLEQEGFIEVIPRKGTYVKELDIKDIMDVLELRVILEGFAAEQAAAKIGSSQLKAMHKLLERFDQFVAENQASQLIEIDHQFHDIIYSVNSNGKLKEIIKNLQEQFYRFRTIYFSEHDDFQQIISGHRALYAAIAAKDGQRAKQVAQSHIQLVIDSVDNWANSKKRRR